MSRRGLLCLAAGLSLASPAVAHRGHSTLSVVEIEARTGAVTVTHRVAAHDLEPALVQIAPDAQPSVDDADALAALIGYAGRAFVIRDAAGARVALTHAATDLAGDDVRLVYTAVLRPPAAALTVDSNLFEETHPDQENQVNVRRARITRTVVFRPGGEAQRIEFD